MALNEQQITFVDAFLETASPEASAIFAGYSKKDARRIAYDLLANDEVQEFLIEREKIFQKISEVQKMDKHRMLRAMYYQYGKANNLNKTTEATAILEKIAKFCGVEPDKVKLDAPVIIINNLDEGNI
jgi:phage terminase small subunit